jgi:hypothetical protein
LEKGKEESNLDGRMALGPPCPHVFCCSGPLAACGGMCLLDAHSISRHQYSDSEVDEPKEQHGEMVSETEKDQTKTHMLQRTLGPMSPHQLGPGRRAATGQEEDRGEGGRRLWRGGCDRRGVPVQRARTPLASSMAELRCLVIFER